MVWMFGEEIETLIVGFSRPPHNLKFGLLIHFALRPRTGKEMFQTVKHV